MAFFSTYVMTGFRLNWPKITLLLSLTLLLRAPEKKRPQKHATFFRFLYSPILKALMPKLSNAISLIL